MKRNFYLSVILLIVFSGFSTFSFAQRKTSLKFNFGTSFSKPEDELGSVARKGKSMQPAISVEAGRLINYGSSNYGIRVAAVGGLDYANFLSNDATTVLKTSITSIKGRVYPISYNGSVEKALDNAKSSNNFFGDLGMGLLIYSFVNSLHVDYGVGFGKIVESSNIDDPNFAEETVNRNMMYFGWGFQPQIYTSESGKWNANAFFDFGKYKWKNGNGNTSSIKASSLGFGFQYNF